MTPPPRLPHEPQAIIEVLRLRDDIESSALLPVELLVIGVVTCIALVAYTFMCRRRQQHHTTVAQLVLWPSILDAIDGGDRRERVLFPHRFF